jgi:hypothetical protein
MTKNLQRNAALALFLMSGTAFSVHAAPVGATKNIVLVHGAFADGSGGLR